MKLYLQFIFLLEYTYELKLFQHYYQKQQFKKLINEKKKDNTHMSAVGK